MELISTYKVKIKDYNHLFDETIQAYRNAVSFFVPVVLNNWDNFKDLTKKEQCNYMEFLTIRTKKRPSPLFCFEDYKKEFYKFPSYLRRAAISEAIGMVSSYKSNLENWENKNPINRGKKPALPTVGHSFPSLYKKEHYKRTGVYSAKIKVRIRNTWDFVDIQLRKSDIDYINRHCANKKECPPTLTKRGKRWYLDFPFKEKVSLKKERKVSEQVIVAVDLGLNNSAVCTVMDSEGTIHARRFLSCNRLQDSLNHTLNKIKKAQKLGAYKPKSLWSRATGLNKQLVSETSSFIIGVALEFDADIIVFEHLDLNKKKKGSKKQRLALWRHRDVQHTVEHKAHELGVRIRRIFAGGTSKLAFDGSGIVNRGTYIQDNKEIYNYSICMFPNGKTYNCDLNAAYNIGARYFIKEKLKTLSEKTRLDIEAKVPQCAKRSTCTLATLISLNAELLAR